MAIARSLGRGTNPVQYKLGIVMDVVGFFYASSVMIAKNSLSLISPSPSKSNSSIIACLEMRMNERPLRENCETYNSSSSSVSLSSRTTRLRFFLLILPVLSSSKSWKALRISSAGSLASIFSATVESEGAWSVVAAERGVAKRTNLFWRNPHIP